MLKIKGIQEIEDDEDNRIPYTNGDVPKIKVPLFKIRGNKTSRFKNEFQTRTRTRSTTSYLNQFRDKFKLPGGTIKRCPSRSDSIKTIYCDRDSSFDTSSMDDGDFDEEFNQNNNKKHEDDNHNDCLYDNLQLLAEDSTRFSLFNEEFNYNQNDIPFTVVGMKVSRHRHHVLVRVSIFHLLRCLFHLPFFSFFYLFPTG